MKKRILQTAFALALSVFALGSLSLTVSADSAENENYHVSGKWAYTVLEDGTAAVSGYTGTDTKVTVPGKLDDYTVTSLGGGWYADGTGNIITYGNVHNVEYDESGSVTQSEVYSPFSGNEQIQSVTLPQTVTYVGANSFKNCTSLTEVNFDKCEELSVIGNNCFEGCTALESVTIPESVQLIDQQAFAGCTSLKSYSFGGEAALEAEIFENCTALETAWLPEGVTSVPPYTFSGCTALKEISLPETVTEIGDSSFLGCTALESFSLPQSVTAIYNNAFSGCTSLTQATFGDKLETLGSRALADCGLKELTLPDSLVRIGDSAFGMTADGELIEGFTLNCGDYSAAANYAADNGINTTAQISESQMGDTTVTIAGSSINIFTILIIVLAVIAAVIVVIIILSLKNRNVYDNLDEDESDD